MKYTDFQNLLVITSGNSEIAGLAAGTYFLFSAQEWQKGDYGVGNSQAGKGTDLRHKVHYQRKVDPIDSYGIVGPAVGYVAEYDVLEDDYQGTESKTPVRKKITTDAARDDDDRRGERLLADPDYS